MYKYISVVIVFFVIHLIIMKFVLANFTPIDFVYKDFLHFQKIQTPFETLANFDGIHYLLISKLGYSEYEQAFFPLYPTLMSLLSFGLEQKFYSGLGISIICLMIGLRYFYLIIRIMYKKDLKNSLLFFLLYPGSFFLICIYTESLFFMLSMMLFYCLLKKKWLWVCLFAYCAALTKFIGIFWFIPILFVVYKERINIYQKISIILSPLLGLLTYMVYLFITVRNPIAFFTSQSAFGAQRSTDSVILLPQVIYRYIKILITADPHSTAYFVSVLELMISIFIIYIFFNIGFKWYKKTLALSIFEIGVIIACFTSFLAPTLTGTLSSIVRYSLMFFPMYIYLTTLPKLTQWFTLVIFVSLHIILFSLFILGYFVG